jgi:hypothetical protein
MRGATPWVAPLKCIGSSFRGLVRGLTKRVGACDGTTNNRKARSNVFPPGGMDPLSVPVVGFA